MQNHSANPSGGDIYTLAQNGTETGKSAIVLTGIGSDLNNRKALKGRAKRKLITQKMMLSLVDVSDSKESIKNKKGYWNTYHCQNKVFTSNDKLYGKYCKNRFCTVCCSIRKADIINRYLPVLQNWPEPYFVTLTVKAVPRYKLKAVMKSMNRGIKRIINKYRKRKLRSKGIKLEGIRSLECNFNCTKRTYNPHFHFIVPKKEVADILIREWLQCSKEGWTVPQAQKMSKVFNNEIALIEIVKYGSKIFTEPDINKKINSKDKPKIYAAALYNIFDAMKGLRIFERFGFNLPKESTTKLPAVSIVKDYQAWEYDLKGFDWFNAIGIGLSQFDPVSQLIELLVNNIDTLLE